jgi:hypothetical protein
LVVGGSGVQERLEYLGGLWVSCEGRSDQGIFGGDGSLHVLSGLLEALTVVVPPLPLLSHLSHPSCR